MGVWSSLWGTVDKVRKGMKTSGRKKSNRRKGRRKSGW
jgi:hypothetical protein